MVFGGGIDEGNDLEAEARRIGEVKEVGIWKTHPLGPVSLHVSPRYSGKLLSIHLWRDLEKSLENEQKKLQEEKKRNEELQKDAKDGIEEPGGPPEADEKAQIPRRFFIAVTAEERMKL